MPDEPNGGHPSLSSRSIPPTQPLSTSLATLSIHADDLINSSTDVAPALHVSTTFRYPRDPALLNPTDDLDIPDRGPTDPIPSDSHVYSRLTAPNQSRLELMLSQILGGPVLAYTSGLSAFHALLVRLHPKVVAIGKGYHGCHGVLDIYKKLTNCKVANLFDEKSWEGEGWRLGEGDVVHLETPVNPTGEAYDIAHFAKLAHDRGALLTVDATFGPPPLQDPFAWGADYVIHSGTKYFGGHSDMLCGVIALSKTLPDWEKRYWNMAGERVFLGSVMGSLEGWLGVRSLRTLELRVRRQSLNAGKIVDWIHSCLASASHAKPPSSDTAAAVRKVVAHIAHASLQHNDMHWLSKQMPNGYGPVFSMWMTEGSYARKLPSLLRYFHHATSLGGVESLIEWRRMSDQGVEETLCRVSVGVEDWKDLKEDLRQAFERLGAEGG